MKALFRKKRTLIITVIMVHNENILFIEIKVKKIVFGNEEHTTG